MEHQESRHYKFYLLDVLFVYFFEVLVYYVIGSEFTLNLIRQLCQVVDPNRVVKHKADDILVRVVLQPSCALVEEQVRTDLKQGRRTVLGSAQEVVDIQLVVVDSILQQNVSLVVPLINFSVKLFVDFHLVQRH